MVFISYSTDDLAAALSLRDVLEVNGIECWTAVRDIPAGGDYSIEIPRTIDKCAAFVLVLTKSSQESKHCHRELDLAVSKDKLILPFQIDSAPLTESFNYYLTTVQRIHAFQRVDAAYQELIGEIRRRCGSHSSDSDSKKPTMPGKSADELFRLGQGYYYGQGVTRNVVMAIKFTESALQLGISNEHDRQVAKGLLPRMYYWAGRHYADSANGDSETMRKAISYYVMAAEYGDAWALCELGRCYRNGNGIEPDLEKSVRYTLQAADQGDFGANYDMGDCYFNGLGVERDYQKAAEYYAQAADMNLEESTYNKMAVYLAAAKSYHYACDDVNALRTLEKARDCAETETDKPEIQSMLSECDRLHSVIGLQSIPEPVISQTQEMPILRGRVFVEGFGSIDSKTSGGVIGNPGSGKAIEAIELRMDGPAESSIAIKAHMAYIGWTPWKWDGFIGTADGRLGIQAIELLVRGPLAEQFSICYRVYSREFAWMGWAKDGEPAGTKGSASPLEAIEVCIVRRGNHPHDTGKAYIED